MTNMIEVMKNKNNIIPMVGVTIGTVTTVIAVAAMFSPTLFDLLSVGAIAGMGFSPALLGIIAALSLAFVFTSVQQMITNEAVKNTRGQDGAPGKDGLDVSAAVAQYILNNHGTLGIKDGKISADKDMLRLTLSTADYNALTKGEVDKSEVSLSILLFNPATNDAKEVKVKFTHHEIYNTDESEPFSVRLTAVNDESDPEKMKAELGLIENSNKQVVVSNQPFESLINGEMVASAMKGPIVNAFMNHIAK